MFAPLLTFFMGLLHGPSWSSFVKLRLVVLAVCCLALGACGTMSKLWPFGKKAKPGPEAVQALVLVNADGSPATYPQYWSRNALVIDLSGIGGTGSVAAKLPAETSWPVRVAVRVRPGSVQQIEIQGEERNVLPVSGDGVKPIDLELAPTVYTPQTAAIYISWGPMPVFVEAAAPEETPAFVSPTLVPGSTTEAEPTASDIIPPGSTTEPPK
jgi:hypothetical protein